MTTTADLTPNFEAKTLARDFYALRVVAVLPASLLITLGLIWGMERLIRSEAIELPPQVEYTVPNPVLDLVEPTPPQRFKPEPPKPAELAPQLPEMSLLEEFSGGNTVEAINIEQTKVKTNIGRFSSDVPVPTMMIQPEYPRIATVRGYEGFVDVQFDVMATGATANVVVLNAVPERVFDRAAVRAVQRWKYSPVMVDGEAQVYRGMVQRLTFELAD